MAWKYLGEYTGKGQSAKAASAEKGRLFMGNRYSIAFQRGII